MRNRRFHAFIFLVVACLCSPVSGGALAQSKFRSDQLLVMPAVGATPASVLRFHQSHGAQVLRTFNGIRGLQVVRLTHGVTVEEAIDRYQRSGLVEYAEPDYEVQALNTPNDPRYLECTQWALHSMGQGGGTVDAHIDAPEAWDVRNSASNLVVAVIHTGVRYSHEDLVANMWTNSADGSFGLNALTATSNPSDEDGHGTPVAGVLGAVGNNAVGISGVAWRVRIMACRALGSLGNGNVSDIITCLDYARTNRAAIINASWGLNEPSDSLSNAVHSLREAGIILVAACGIAPTKLTRFQSTRPVIPSTTLSRLPSRHAIRPGDQKQLWRDPG